MSPLLLAARDWRALADAVIDHLTDLWHRQAPGRRPLRLELDVRAALGAHLEGRPDDPHLRRLCRWLDEQHIRYRISCGHVAENRLRVTWGERARQ